MGVDISTYRSRIGSFRHGPGLDVILIRVCVNYSGGLQMVGALTFIGMLLIMAGVETNPGPLDKPAVSLEEGEMSADKMLDIGKTTGRASHRVSPARQTSTSGQTVSVNSSGLQTGTTVNNTNISLSDQDQPVDPPVVQEASTATINPDASVPTMSSAQDTPLGNNQTTPSPPDQHQPVDPPVVQEASTATIHPDASVPTMSSAQDTQQGNNQMTHPPPGEMSADKMLDIGKTTGRASHRVSPARQTSTSGQTVSVNSSGLQTGTTVTNTNISLSDQDQPVDPLVVQEASTATINPDVSVPTMSSAQDTPLGNNQTTPSSPGEMLADKMLDIGKTTGRASHRVSPARQTSTSGQTVSVNSSGLQTGTTVTNTNISLSDQDQPVDPLVVQEASTATIHPDASVPTMSSAQDTQQGNNQMTHPPPDQHQPVDLPVVQEASTATIHSDASVPTMSSAQDTQQGNNQTTHPPPDQHQPVDPPVVQEASTATIHPDAIVPTMSSAQDTQQGNNQMTHPPPDQHQPVDPPVVQEASTATIHPDASVPTMSSAQDTQQGNNQTTHPPPDQHPPVDPPVVQEASTATIHPDASVPTMSSAQDTQQGNNQMTHPPPDQHQPVDPPVVQEASTATIHPDASVPTMSSAQDTQQGNNQTTHPPPVNIPSKEAFFSLLDKLHLSDWFPGKITLQYVTSIDMLDNSSKKTIVDLPWLVLQRIVTSNKHARDKTVVEIVAEISRTHDDRKDDDASDNSTDDDDDDDDDVVDDNNDDLCPLDVFIVVFYCCDAMLKQYLCKKMFMCRLAVPFMYADPNSVDDVTLSVWPLRPIVMELMDSQNKTTKNTILEQPTKLIVFSRIGRPMYSKSKLQNDLLSDDNPNTFYNIDCPFGMSKRCLTDGYVEVSWYLPSGNTSGLFNEVLTFVNVRGNLLSFTQGHANLLKDIASVFVIVTDTKTLLTQFEDVSKSIASIENAVIIIDNLKCKDLSTVKKQVRRLKKQHTDNNKSICVEYTCNKIYKRNASEMQMAIHNHLNTFLKAVQSTSLSTCFELHSTFDIKSDEECLACSCGKYLAESLLCKIESKGPQKRWKALNTPLQYKYWREWSNLKKSLHRSINSPDVVQGIMKEMDDKRKSQTETVSDTMTLFMETIVDIIDDRYKVLYFIEWIKLFLDARSRAILPDIRKKHTDAWEKLKRMKNKTNSNADGCLSQNEYVQRLETELADATFGVEHLFREMGQIYEAKISTKSLNLKVSQTANAMATLISYGLPFELLDGDARNIPFDWVEAVLKAVNEKAGCEKIMTLSVLGIQSSGKSTLLNTMFSLHFSVSAGRCTRGVYMQLIPMKRSPDLPFSHIMVIDSEGLRAPELLGQMKRNDNELAIFIIGLGDITLLNIKGENTSEINDVLDITVHAFLRLKAANKRLDLKNTCIFAHQNVPAINAKEKMKLAKQKLLEHLDKMTKEAAIAENIHDITSFNQVIKFDGSAHVWYFPDLWKGDPPMAAINVGYSTKVSELKHFILKAACEKKYKIYKSVEDILIHSKDVWQGILSEDFVFSFKNSLEIKAYLLLETEYKTLAWQLQCFVREKTLNSKNNFSKCQTENETNTTLDTEFESLSTSLVERTKASKQQLELFSKTCDYLDVICKWIPDKIIGLDILSNKLQMTMEKELRQFASRRNVQIVLTLSLKKHEEKLHEESISLAANLKGKELTSSDIDSEFERIWERFVDVIKKTNVMTYKPMKKIFVEKLTSTFHTNSLALSSILENRHNLENGLCLRKLSQTFDKADIIKDDIAYQSMLMRVFQKHKKHRLDYLKIITENIFQETDLQINQLIQEKDTEIGVMQVNQFLHDLIERLETIEKSTSCNTSWTLNISYKAKMCVYISCHAWSKFEQHNKFYGTKAQMERYKKKVRAHFEVYLDERKSEAIAAKLFRNEIESFVMENVKERLTIKVEQYLMSNLPCLKFHLIIDMLSQLVDNGTFKEFITYIESPEVYADTFIMQRCQQLLFSGDTSKYGDLATGEIYALLSDIRSAIATASKRCTKFSTINEWIQNFSESLTICSIEMERFRDIKRVHVDFDNFQNNLKSEMILAETSLKEEFVKKTMDTIQWTNRNPCASFFERVWGCKDKCAYCGEPCSKHSDHITTTNHTCVQHRPSGLDGAFLISDHTVRVTTCNFKIQSDLAHTCDGFQFMCNPVEKEKCSKGSHKYKDYREFLKTWDIEPTSDMSDTCKVWMWFMAKYKADLAQHYGYKVNTIPESWSNITKEEAIESLRHVYKAF